MEIKSANFSDVNLNKLINLEKLSISGKIGHDFNFRLFKKVCKHLKELSISLENIAKEEITELFYGLNFPYLDKLTIKKSQLSKLKKKFFNGFPKLQTLSINNNEELWRIDDNTFSSLKDLVHLDLSSNLIESINKRQFSKLTNLETLVLSKNRIECIEKNAFLKLKNLKKFELSGNSLSMLNPQLFIGLKKLDLSISKEF